MKLIPEIYINKKGDWQKQLYILSYLDTYCFYFCPNTIPYSKYSERAVLHSEGKMDSIYIYSCTANWFFHVTPCY